MTYEFLACGISETNVYLFWKIPGGCVIIYPPEVARLKYPYVQIEPQGDK